MCLSFDCSWKYNHGWKNGCSHSDSKGFQKWESIMALMVTVYYPMAITAAAVVEFHRELNAENLKKFAVPAVAFKVFTQWGCEGHHTHLLSNKETCRHSSMQTIAASHKSAQSKHTKTHKHKNKPFLLPSSSHINNSSKISSMFFCVAQSACCDFLTLSFDPGGRYIFS